MSADGLLICSSSGLTRSIGSGKTIVDAGLGGKDERYVPRPYALAALARVLAPRLVRRATSGKGGGRLVTKTGRGDT